MLILPAPEKTAIFLHEPEEETVLILEPVKSEPVVPLPDPITLYISPLLSVT